MTTLSRRLSCAAARSPTSDVGTAEADLASTECSDRVACEHLSEDHFVYRGNLLVRAGDALVLVLSRYLGQAGAAEEVSTLMDVAAAERCSAVTRCEYAEVEECLAIV